MDEDLPPSPFIKKRPKGSIRPSGSTSSLRSLAATPTTTAPNGNGDDDGGDGDDADMGNVAVVRSRGKKTPAGRVKERQGTKQKSRLSFGGAADEGEAENGGDDDAGFVVKRSSAVDSPASASRRLLRPTGTPSALPTNLDQATISPAARPAPPRSMYSKEYLDQLKADTLASPKPTAPDYDDLTRSKFGSQVDDDQSSIPTSAAIAQAKKRREQARIAGVENRSNQDGGSGFIPLEVGFAAKGGESRLVREEDEIGDGDEDVAQYTGADEKVPLGSKANKEAARRMREGISDMIHDAQEEEEEDPEAREWEEAQIKRGEQKRAGAVSSKTARKPYIPTPIPQSSPLPTLSAVSSRLQAALSTLTSSHTLDSAALDHFAREKAELDEQERELRTQVETVEEKHRWFSDFKNFMEDVAAFLDDKFPALEAIEQENLAIQRERYDIIARRRFADDSDDVALFTGADVPSIFALETEGQEGLLTVDPPNVRAGRRHARRARRQPAQPSQNGAAAEDEPHLGTYTDDELPSDTSADLSDAIASLRTSLSTLFSDVKADDFRDPNLGIRKRFEEWRAKYADDYGNAFGGLALVGVWEFWARVEMSMWNPFEISQLPTSPPGLDAYQWHASLTSYGHVARASSIVSNEDGQEEDAAESEEVVNALVTTVVIPRLEKLARAAFDPLSRKQTMRAVGLVDEVSYCVEKSSPRFESLVQAFVSRVQLAITQSQSLIAPNLALLAQLSRAFDPSTFTARLHFLQRQYKLLENALKWRRFARSVRLSARAADEHFAGAGMLFDELLQRELVAKVMLPVIEASWSTGGQEIAIKVLSVLPGDVSPALRRRLEGQSA